MRFGELPQEASLDGLPVEIVSQPYMDAGEEVVNVLCVPGDARSEQIVPLKDLIVLE